MISFRIHGQRFQVRAAAIFIHDDCVLVHKAEPDVFWSMPGGRVEIGEDGSSALKREMKEEIGQEVVCHRLVYVAEAFFSLNGERNHELGLYYLTSLPQTSPFLRKQVTHAGLEPKQRLAFRWVELSQLNAIDLRPHFLKRKLLDIGSGTEHVLHLEERDEA